MEARMSEYLSGCICIFGLDVEVDSDAVEKLFSGPRIDVRSPRRKEKRSESEPNGLLEKIVVRMFAASGVLRIRSLCTGVQGLQGGGSHVSHHYHSPDPE